MATLGTVIWGTILVERVEPRVASRIVERFVGHGCSQRGFGIGRQSRKPGVPSSAHTLVGRRRRLTRLRPRTP